jgi:hypothetical protein
MYAALESRPVILFSVTALSRYNVVPLEIHLTATRRVLRYLKTISELRIHYRQLPHPHTDYQHTTSARISNPPISVVGFTSSDWAGNLTTRKLIGGCILGLGYIDDNNELVIY